MNKRRPLVFLLLGLLLGLCLGRYALPARPQAPAPVEKPDVALQEAVTVTVDRSQAVRATLELRGETLYEPVDCPEALLGSLLDALEGVYVPVSYNAPMAGAGSPSRLTVRLYGPDGGLLDAGTQVYYSRPDSALPALLRELLGA